MVSNTARTLWWLGAVFAGCLVELELRGTCNITLMYMLMLLYVVSLSWKQESTKATELRAARVERESMTGLLPSAAHETAYVSSLLVQSIWPNFIRTKVAHVMAPLLSKILERQVNRKITKWNLELDCPEFDIGTAAPTVDLLSACYNRHCPELVGACDANFKYASKDLKLLLRAKHSTLNLILTVTVTRVTAKGIMRFIPLPSENFLAISFLMRPTFTYGLHFSLTKAPQLATPAVPANSVKGSPFDSDPVKKLPDRMHFSVPTIPPLTHLVKDVIQQVILEPRRQIAPFFIQDADTGTRCIGGTVNIVFNKLSNVHNLFKDPASAFYIVVQVNKNFACSPLLTQRTCAHVSWTAKMAIKGRACQAVIKIVSVLPGKKEKLNVVGQVLLDVQYLLEDRTTAFWALGQNMGPVAKRWHGTQGPWQVSLPIEQPPHANSVCAMEYAASGVSSTVLPFRKPPLLPESLDAASNAQFVAEARRVYKEWLASGNTAELPLDADASSSGSESVSSYELQGAESDMSDETSFMTDVDLFSKFGAQLNGDDDYDDDFDNDPRVVTASSKGEAASGASPTSVADEGTRFEEDADVMQTEPRAWSKFWRSRRLGKRSTARTPSSGLQRSGEVGSSSALDAGESRSVVIADEHRRRLLHEAEHSSLAETFQRLDESQMPMSGYCIPYDLSQQAIMTFTVSASDWRTERTTPAAATGAEDARKPLTWSAVEKQGSASHRSIVVTVHSIDLSSSLPDWRPEGPLTVTVEYGAQSTACLPIDPGAARGNPASTFVFQELSSSMHKLCFSVTRSAGKSSELLGSASWPIEGLAPNQVAQRTVHLSSIFEASVLVTAAVVPGVSDRPEVCGMFTNLLPPLETFTSKGHVYVLVERARGLIAADASGYSDPYLVIDHGRTRYKSPIRKQTLSPTWLYARLLDREQDGDTVMLQCVDNDMVGRDDPIGSVNIDLVQASHSFHGWVELRGVASGEVYVRIVQHPENECNELHSPSAFFDTPKQHSMSRHHQQPQLRLLGDKPLRHGRSIRGAKSTRKSTRKVTYHSDGAVDSMSEASDTQAESLPSSPEAVVEGGTGVQKSSKSGFAKAMQSARKRLGVRTSKKDDGSQKKKGVVSQKQLQHQEDAPTLANTL